MLCMCSACWPEIAELFQSDCFGLHAFNLSSHIGAMDDAIIMLLCDSITSSQSGFHEIPCSSMLNAVPFNGKKQRRERDKAR